MGFSGQTYSISLEKTGYNANPNYDAVPATSLISPSKNVVLHRGGVEKRGGTAKMNSTTLSGSPTIAGLYQFKTSTGSNVLICGTSGGNIISDPTGTPTTRKTGLGTNAYYDFMTYNDDCYITPFASGTETTTLPLGYVWTTRTLPASRQWRALAANGANLVAIASNTDKCAISADNGATWTEKTLPASRDWRAVASNGANVVAVAYNTDKCAISADNGATWTEKTLPIPSTWQGVSSNGANFVVVGATIDYSATAYCATSTDNGATWSEVTLINSLISYTCIASNGANFVTLPTNSTSCRYSANNGSTWNTGTLPASRTWTSIATNGTVWCAIASGTDKYAISYDNGATWSEQTFPTSKSYSGITYGGGMFMVVTSDTGTYGLTSTDALNWTPRTFNNSAVRYAAVYGSTSLCVLNYSTTNAETSIATAITTGVAPQKWNGSDTLTTQIGIPTPCTAALAGAGAGNVNAGTHSYKITFVTSHGETSGSNTSNIVTTTAGDGKVNLSAIQVGPTGTTARKIYRTNAGDTGDYKLIATLSDNTTTTYLDNIADGAGAAVPTANTAQTIPTDWGTCYPKQFIVHGYGNSERVWGFATTGKAKWIYVTPNNDGASDADFSQDNILTLYIETGDGYGIVGGAEFKDKLLAFGRQKTYLIDDADIDTTNWGYIEAPWDGGAASYRLITKTPNDIIVMGDDGDIYSVTAAQQFGESRLASLSRPHYIHEYIKNNIDLSQIEKFHSVHDPVLRAVRFFMVRKGQTQVDTCMSYYYDLSIWGPPEDNLTYASGFNASSSAVIKVSDGTYNVYTGDYSGFIWQLNRDDKHDDNNAIEGTFRLPMLSLEQDEVGASRMQKLFKTGWVIGTPQSGVTLTATIYVDGDQDYTTESILLTDTGTTGILDKDFPIGMYGKRISPKFSNSVLNAGFFVSQLLIDFKTLGANP